MKTKAIIAVVLMVGTLSLPGCGTNNNSSTKSESNASLPSESQISGGDVTVTFYNPDLSGKVMNNVTDFIGGDGGGRNDYTVDVNSLTVKNSDVLSASGSDYIFDVSGKPAALAINWPTAPSGWGLIILDNQGKGFSGNEKIIFNYQAALDYKFKIDNALKARSDYVPSAKFKTAYDGAAAHIKAAQSSSSDSVKGIEGQQALNDLAVAYDTLLSEYGPFYAKKNLNSQSPMLAVTIDRTSDYKENLDTVAKIAAPYAWIRIVFDVDDEGNIDTDQYKDLVNYAHQKGIKIVGQPCDSSYDAKLITAKYLSNFQQCVNAFPDIDVWEVGNEVNGSWLSSEISEKIMKTADWLKSKGKTTMLTAFWQLNTGGQSNSIFSWLDSNIPDEVKKTLI